MADNYLEKKYEEFQARKNGAGKKKTNSIHKMRRVFVTGGADGIGKTIVKAFRMAGNRVAFCDTNEVLGKETAEKQGQPFIMPTFMIKKHLTTACAISCKNGAIWIS